MSEFMEMNQAVEQFFSELEKDMVSNVDDPELKQELVLTLKHDFQDANFLNMVAAKMKAKNVSGEEIRNLTGYIKHKVENFHPNVKYLEVNQEYLK